MIEVVLMMAGMEIGRTLNVAISLPMNVFTNIETVTKNKHRDTLNKFTLHPARLAMIKKKQEYCTL